MAKEKSETRTERQGREIQAIIDASNDDIRARNLEGRDLLEAREKCSRAIAEAARRHVAENNAPDAEAESAGDDDGKGEPEPGAGEAALPGTDMVR